MGTKEFPSAGEPQDIKIEDSSHQSGVNVVDNQSVRIPPSGEIFSYKPHASDMIRAPHVIIKSNGRGPRGPKYAERVGRTMRSVNSRRIKREARKAFGETPEEQAANFAQQFLDSRESYTFMAQDLKEQRGIRLGEDALKKLAKKFKKKIDEDEIVRLCLEECLTGDQIVERGAAGSTGMVSRVLRSRNIFRPMGRRPKPAEKL